ncbi:hypothetical protein D3C72_281550 [compost metagenome]
MYRQGSLDSLCGVYAVINSVKAVAHTRGFSLRRWECRALFSRLCGVLADGGLLADALTHGTTIRTFQAMTRDAHEWLLEARGLQLECRRAFGKSPESLDQFWRKLSDHAQDQGPGSVLIGLSGRMEHWSCIRSINDRAIVLVDSDGARILRRELCTIADPDRRRIHQLLPTQALLVTCRSGART